MSSSEAEYLLELKARKAGAFEKLVHDYSDRLYGLAYRFMGDHGAADDVVQETFVKAYNALENFRGDSSLKSWLYTITANTARNALRSRARSNPVTEADVQEIPTVHLDFSRMEKKQTAEILKRAIEELPQKQKRALELRIFDDLPFKEIAEIMDCPFDTAKANFRHALLNLKKILTEGESGDRTLRELKIAFESLAEDEGDLS